MCASLGAQVGECLGNVGGAPAAPNGGLARGEGWLHGRSETPGRERPNAPFVDNGQQERSDSSRAIRRD
eukprot:1975126-Lingulodinium_polyedra.AAC.1